MKTARVTHDVCTSLCCHTFLTSVQLNKEIGELEALVESKVCVVDACGAKSDSIYRFIAKWVSPLNIDTYLTSCRMNSSKNSNVLKRSCRETTRSRQRIASNQQICLLASVHPPQTTLIKALAKTFVRSVRDQGTTFSLATFCGTKRLLLVTKTQSRKRMEIHQICFVLTVRGMDM